MQCSMCGLFNPPSQTRCDCGYEFATGQQGAALAPPNHALTTPEVLLVIVAPVIGIIYGMTLRPPQRRKMMIGYSVALAIAYVVLGAVLNAVK